jgi:hypothetical protein
MPKVRPESIPAGTTPFLIDDDKTYSLAKGVTRNSTDTDWTILIDTVSSGAKLGIAGKVGQTGTHVDINKDAAIGIQGMETTIEIAKTGSITGYRGLYVAADAANAKITLKGTIDAEHEGIASVGDDTQITNSGKITGITGANSHGIYSNGDRAKINNAGTIATDGMGILSAGDAANITNSGTITSKEDSGIFCAGADARVDNKGKIVSDEDHGIYAAGANATVTNSGKIISMGDAEAGVGANKANVVIVNTGSITSSNNGIYSGGADAHITNSGKITVVELGNGIAIGGGNATIVNTGKITIDTGAVISSTLSPGSVNITNKGRIETTNNGFFDRAVELGTAADTVVNKGVMIGKIDLGGGNDVFDNRGGKIDSDVVGGLGDDTLVVGSAKTKLIEASDGGSDTVRSTVSYVLSDNIETLQLLGKGKINATGNAGDNTLAGNTGSNILKGLGGADTFVFATGGGRDTIADFAAGADKIDLSGWVFTDHEDLLNDPNTVEKNGNLVITAGKDQLTILGVGKDDLDEGDFVF